MMLQGSVSQQLDDLCDSSPVCVPARLKRYRESQTLLQAAAAREEELRMHLQQRDAEVARLLQQLGERDGGDSATVV